MKSKKEGGRGEIRKWSKSRMKDGRRKSRVRVGSKRKRSTSVAAEPGWVFWFCCRGFDEQTDVDAERAQFCLWGWRIRHSARCITTDVHQYTVWITEDVLFLLRVFRQRPVKMQNQLSWEEPLPKLPKVTGGMSRNNNIRLHARTDRLAIHLSVVWPSHHTNRI